MWARRIFFVFSALTAFVKAQDYYEEKPIVREGNDLLWCCLSEEELAKCRKFAEAINQDQDLSEELAFGSDYRRLKCKLYFSKNECMRLIDANKLDKPNLMTLDAGEVFTGGRYNSLVPILREVYDDDKDYAFAVAVVKRGTLEDVLHLKDFRGKKACFSGVSSMGGWIIPMYRLIDSGVMDVVDCNNHVKSAINFFGDSCSVDSLQDRYNPLGDNSHKFCEICGSSVPGIRCTSRDPYSGFAGALLCLQDKGEVAFLNEKTVRRNIRDTDEYELLCPDDAGYIHRRSIEDYKDCGWGVAPGNALVVSSAMAPKERKAIQSLFKKAIKRYGGRAPSFYDTSQNDTIVQNKDKNKKFYMFESAPKYGGIQNLMFDDDVTGFVDIVPDDQSYKTYLDRIYGDALRTPNEAIAGVRKCPVGQMTLCVTSVAEMRKCIRMRTALNAQLLEPKMSCKKVRSQMACMRMIAANEADVTVLDAGDIYRAGWTFGLIPIMAEVYNLPGPYYYAVAVVKQRDNSSELIYLKRKNTCHTGVGQAAGWIVPMAWLIGNERIRDYGCDSSRAAAEYFNKACAPGIQSPEFQDRYEENYWEYSHLCDLCHGTGGDYCQRNHMEDYYGHTGAFRCLVEGGGDVAFVKHTAVYENCDGKRKEWWARNQLTTDYELLCRDGTRAPARDYKKCYLGKVKANAIVTNPSFSREKIDAFINLFKYAQQFYGQKTPDEFSFSMFISSSPYADLIFQDATQQLIVLPEEERDYTKYLGKEFLKAYTTVECRSTSGKLTINLFLTLVFASLLKFL